MAPKVGSFSRNDLSISKKKVSPPHPPKVKKYKCVECNENVSFESKGALQSHFKDRHCHRDWKKMISCTCGNYILKSKKGLHECPIFIAAVAIAPASDEDTH